MIDSLSYNNTYYTVTSDLISGQIFKIYLLLTFFGEYFFALTQMIYFCNKYFLMI